MKKAFKENGPLLGAHMSVAGGLDTAFERADRVGCTALQIFTKNSNQWNDPVLTEDDVQKYLQAKINSKVRIVVSHNSYLINLCAATEYLLNRSRKAFIAEIKRCSLLGIRYLIFHPGAHTTLERSSALRLVSESLNHCLSVTADSDVVLLVETTAGQGTTVGSTFEEIAAIISEVKDKNRIGVCLDTCHIFAAGYDIRTSDAYRETMKQFDHTVGLKNLFAIHFNDAKKPLNSRVDRHENIGKGQIGKKAFGLFLNDDRLSQIPKILETPKGEDGYKMDVVNLRVLRSLISK